MFNCFRPQSRRSFSLSPSLLSFFLHCCFLLFLSLSSHISSLPLSSPSLFAEQPSPGQLLIRGRNDRCFAHQQCHLFCLSTNSRCAVHIYFRKKRAVAQKNTHICTFTNAHTHILSSSVNSPRHRDAESRLKYNRFSSLHFFFFLLSLLVFECLGITVCHGTLQLLQRTDD